MGNMTKQYWSNVAPILGAIGVMVSLRLKPLGWSWHFISELLMIFSGFPALYLVTISLVWKKFSHTTQYHSYFGLWMAFVVFSENGIGGSVSLDAMLAP